MNTTKQMTMTAETARGLYPGAAPEMKQWLEENWGKPFFITDVTERVKTVDDACRELAYDLSSFKAGLAGLTEVEELFRELSTVNKALNEGWAPDWKDKTQEKWFAVLEWNAAKGCFTLLSVRDNYDQISLAGSRFCFKNAKLAKYFATQFEEKNSKFITLNY